MEPLTAESEAVAFADTHARALLHLGRSAAARPLVEKLLAKGWSRRAFRELCEQRGLVP